MNIESPILPEFDPPKKGVFQGRLRISFIKAMDKIAYDEIFEIIGKALPLFIEFNFHPSIKFSYLRKHFEYISNYKIQPELKRKFDNYVNLFIGWAEKYNVDADWYLDALHERFGHIVEAENYYNFRLSFLKYNQLKSLLVEYQEIKNDEYALFERKQLISEFFEILELKDNDFNAEQKLDLIFQFFIDRDEKEVIEIENIWKSKKLEELQKQKAILIKGAIEMSYNYDFMFEVSDFPFSFEFRSWQFNEEKKKEFRKKITEAFKSDLDKYFNIVEDYAKEQGHKKMSSKDRDGINQTDRIYLFILYQVKKLSPDKCLNTLQEIQSKEIDITTQAVSKIVNTLESQLGFDRRKSRTKAKK
jgi:hypothetical protein